MDGFNHFQEYLSGGSWRNVPKRETLRRFTGDVSSTSSNDAGKKFFLRSPNPEYIILAYSSAYSSLCLACFFLQQYRAHLNVRIAAGVFTVLVSGCFPPLPNHFTLDYQCICCGRTKPKPTPTRTRWERERRHCRRHDARDPRTRFRNVPTVAKSRRRRRRRRRRKIL